MLPLVKTLNIVGEGSLGCEGANLPVLDPTEHGAEAGVRGPGLGAGARLVLDEKKHIIILFICLFIFTLFFSSVYIKVGFRVFVCVCVSSVTLQ